MTNTAAPVTTPAKTVRAALVVIGNEILTGRTHDANTPWIAEKLGPHGIMLAEVRVVPDIEAKIIKAVNDLRAEYDYVLTTGGIGPTHDDITAESIAKAFGVKNVLNPQAREALLKYYGSEAELTAPRLKMATVPEGAALIDNPVSGAPGFVMENVYALAGVPRIMQAMLDHVLTLMDKGAPYLSNTISCSLRESLVAEPFAALQERFPELIMGSYPHYRGGVLGLSLVLRGTDAMRLQDATDQLLAIIRGLGDEPKAMSLQSKKY
jgi:molybdenum cofactor synthesis domain-containing protein